MTWNRPLRYGCLIVLTVLPASGCVSHPPADTVLHIKTKIETGDRPIGFGEVFARGDRIEGYGWHPREHESYAIVGNEPYPVSQPRYLTITPAEETRSAEPDKKLNLRIEMCPKLLDTYSDLIVKQGANTNDALTVFEGDVFVRESTFFGSRILSLENQKLSRVGNPDDFIVISGQVVARPWPGKDPGWLRHRPQP